MGLLALLVPGLAVAATVQCAPEQLASMDRSMAAPSGAPWCEGGLVVRRISHLDVPICLREGASAVAPLPLIPTDGARAEAVPTCKTRDAADHLTTGGDDDPSQTSKAPGHAVLRVVGRAPGQMVELLVLSSLHRQRSSPGHRNAIYRPPRT